MASCNFTATLIAWSTLLRLFGPMSWPSYSRARFSFAASSSSSRSTSPKARPT